MIFQLSSAAKGRLCATTPPSSACQVVPVPRTLKGRRCYDTASLLIFSTFYADENSTTPGIPLVSVQSPLKDEGAMRCR